MIALCNHCETLVYYGTSSDALDGHNCPERLAAMVKDFPSSPRPDSTGGGPVGEEIATEYQLERESLDASAPEMEPEERKLASVSTALLRCHLCGNRDFRPKWDDREPLVCLNCGAVLGAGAA